MKILLDVGAAIDAAFANAAVAYTSTDTVAAKSVVSVAIFASIVTNLSNMSFKTVCTLDAAEVFLSHAGILTAPDAVGDEAATKI